MPRLALLILTLVLQLQPAAVHGENAPPTPESHVIDVRSESEWKEGHLENAILIPYDRIGTDIARITGNRDATLYLYCRSGRRSAIAATTLTRSGYRKLINLGTLENASRVLKRRIIREAAPP
jgi:phage shock protein E